MSLVGEQSGFFRASGGGGCPRNGWNYDLPQTPVLKPQALEPQKVTFLEIWLLQVEVVKMRSQWSRVGPRSKMTGVLVRGGGRRARARAHTHTRPWDGGNRDGGDTFTG